MSRLDRHIKDRLHGMEVTLPAGLWDKIEAELPPPEKSRKGFWLWFTGLGLMLLLALTQSVLKGDHLISPTNKTGIVQEARSQNSEKYNSISSLQDSQKEMVETEIEPEYSEKEPSKTVVNLLASDHVQADQSSLFENTFPGIHKQSNKNKSTIEQDKSALFKSEKSLDEKVLLENENTETASEKSSRTYDRLDRVIDIPSITPLSMIFSERIFESPECPTLGDFAPPGHWFAEVYYGSDYGIRSTSATHPEFNTYNDRRFNNENALYSFSAGIRGGYRFENGFTVKSGIQYSQINEKFSFIDPDAYSSQTIITIDTIFSGGVPTVVTDTSFVQIPGTREVVTYNRYKLIDIPVLIGFETILNDSWSVSGQGGVLFNLALRQKGQFLNTDDNIATFTSNENGAEDIYRTQIGVNLYGSLSAYYHWQKDLDFFIEPSVTMVRTDITRMNYPLSQKYIIPSLKLGLRYKF